MKRDYIYTTLAVILVIACYGFLGADDCKTKAQTDQFQKSVKEQAKARTVQEQRDDAAYKALFGGGK